MMEHGFKWVAGLAFGLFIPAAVMFHLHEKSKWTDTSLSRTVYVYSGGVEVRRYRSAGQVRVHWLHGVRFVDSETGRAVQINPDTDYVVER